MTTTPTSPAPSATARGTTLTRHDGITGGSAATEKALWATAERVMTGPQHLAFWLHHHEGFSQRQIALMLGISRQAVRDRIRGGTARLKQANGKVAA